jgi:hypothetical protein
MVFKCKGIVVLSFFQRSQGDLQASISFFPRLLCLTPLVLFWFLAFPFDLRSHGQCAGKNWRSNETTPGNVSLIFYLFFFSLFFFLLSLLLSAFIHFFFFCSMKDAVFLFMIISLLVGTPLRDILLGEKYLQICRLNLETSLFVLMNRRFKRSLVIYVRYINITVYKYCEPALDLII